MNPDALSQFLEVVKLVAAIGGAVWIFASIKARLEVLIEKVKQVEEDIRGIKALETRVFALEEWRKSKERRR